MIPGADASEKSTQVPARDSFVGETPRRRCDHIYTGGQRNSSSDPQGKVRLGDKNVSDYEARRKPTTAQASASRLPIQDAPKAGGNANWSNEVLPFVCIRIRRVEAGDALYRRLEVLEAFLLNKRGEFGAIA